MSANEIVEVLEHHKSPVYRNRDPLAFRVWLSKTQTKQKV